MKGSYSFLVHLSLVCLCPKHLWNTCQASWQGWGTKRTVTTCPGEHPAQRGAGAGHSRENLGSAVAQRTREWVQGAGVRKGTAAQVALEPSPGKWLKQGLVTTCVHGCAQAHVFYMHTCVSKCVCVHEQSAHTHICVHMCDCMWAHISTCACV